MHWGFGSTSPRREGCDVQTSRLIRGVAWIGVDRRESARAYRDGPVPRRGARVDGGVRVGPLRLPRTRRASPTLGARDLGGGPRRTKARLSPDQIITRLRCST